MTPPVAEESAPVVENFPVQFQDPFAPRRHTSSGCGGECGSCACANAGNSRVAVSRSMLVFMGTFLALMAAASVAHAQVQSYDATCPASPAPCVAAVGDTGAGPQPGQAISRFQWDGTTPFTPRDAAGNALVAVLDAAQSTPLYVPTLPAGPVVPALATVAQVTAAIAALPPPVQSLALSADKSRIIGSTAAGALDPGTPQPQCLSTGGLVLNCKTWAGTVTTGTGGTFTFDYTAAGFTSVPRIRVQAMSTAAQQYIAAPQMPTLTSDIGTVYAPPATSTVSVLGALLTIFPTAPSGVVVQLTATGQ